MCEEVDIDFLRAYSDKRILKINKEKIVVKFCKKRLRSNIEDSR